MPRQYGGRAIQPNHGNPSPRYIIAIDCESHRQEYGTGNTRASHTLRLACTTSCRIVGDRPVGIKRMRFTTANDLRQFIYNFSGKRHTTWIVAHGMLADFRLGEFAVDIDSGVTVIDAPRAKRVAGSSAGEVRQSEGIVVIESPPTIIGLRHVESGGRMVFVDTLNWFKCPLRDLGDACNLPKLPMPAWDDTDEKWFIYCERDTEILYRTFTELVSFASQQQLGVFRYTAASQAMSVFRHRFLKHPIYVHDNTKVKAWERAAYFGGRSEVFRWGHIDTQCHLVDVNSLFPSIMATTKVPTNLVSYDECTMASPTISCDAASSAVAEVFLQTDRAIYPTRSENGIRYPTGRFWTYLCGVELADAVRNGNVRAIRRIAWYDTAIIFDAFVAEFWQLRQSCKQSGNNLYAEFAKSIMNSLYGKFAQRLPQWQTAVDPPAMNPWSRQVLCDGVTGEKTEYRAFGSYVQQRFPDAERDDTFIAISAFITAAARVRMNQLRDIAGAKNTYYQGVDGLIVNDAGLAQLEHSGEVEYTSLGRMRLEYSGSPTTIYGVADYRLGGRNIMAGRPCSAIQISDQEWLATILSSKGDIFSGESPVGMQEWQQTMRRKSGYTKGEVQADSWVLPHEYNQPQGSGISELASSTRMAFDNSSTTGANESGLPSDQISEARNNILFASSFVNPNSDCIRSLF